MAFKYHLFYSHSAMDRLCKAICTKGAIDLAFLDKVDEFVSGNIWHGLWDE